MKAVETEKMNKSIFRSNEMNGKELIKRIVVLVMVLQLVFGQAVFAATSNKDLTLDDGTGDSPSLVLTDAGDFTLTITKADAGEAAIVNNEGAIDFKPSADTDDFLRMLSTGDSSYLYWLGVLAYTNEPGIRVNPADTPSPMFFRASTILRDACR